MGGFLGSQAFLQRKYGNLIRAWRQALSQTDSMVSWLPKKKKGSNIKSGFRLGIQQGIQGPFWTTYDYRFFSSLREINLDPKNKLSTWPESDHPPRGRKVAAFCEESWESHVYLRHFGHHLDHLDSNPYHLGIHPGSSHSPCCPMPRFFSARPILPRRFPGLPMAAMAQVLSKLHFLKAAARLGFAKESKELWKALDKDDSGAGPGGWWLLMLCRFFLFGKRWNWDYSWDNEIIMGLYIVTSHYKWTNTH